MPKQSKLIYDIRAAYMGLYDSNGTEKVKLSGPVERIKGDEVRLNLLKNMIRILKESGTYSEEFILYVTQDIKIKDVNEVINSKYPEASRPFKNTTSKIEVGKRRIAKDFGENAFSDVMYYKNNDIGVYIQNVNRLMSKYFGVGDYVDVKDLMIMDIKDNHIVKSYDGDFIADYGNEISLLSKRKLEKTVNKLNKDKNFIGYFNYLMNSSAKLGSKESAYREKILAILNDVEDTIGNIENSEDTIGAIENNVEDTIGTIENSEDLESFIEFGDDIFDQENNDETDWSGSKDTQGKKLVDLY